MPLAELVLDALPRPATGDLVHPLRFVAALSDDDLAIAACGCAEGLERVLKARARGEPCRKTCPNDAGTGWSCLQLG